MVTPSGIVLPSDRPLILREIGNGLFVVVNAYECDAGYFGQSPLYRAVGAEKPAPSSTPSAVQST